MMVAGVQWPEAGFETIAESRSVFVWKEYRQNDCSWRAMLHVGILTWITVFRGKLKDLKLLNSLILAIYDALIRKNSFAKLIRISTRTSFRILYRAQKRSIPRNPRRIRRSF